MGFSSRLKPGEFIINDSTPFDKCIPPEGMSTGLMLFSRKAPFGAIRNAPAFPKELLIPRSEWQARIQELEEKKANLSDLIDQAGLPCKDQNGTNYCWINAPTHCVEILRVKQNQKMVILSPASAGGPIKNFRNDGGYGQEGLEWIVEHGLVPVDKWPANAIEKKYYTQENIQIALDYRVTEWNELVPRDMDELISCLLRQLPIAAGLNWWSHEVTYYEAVWLDGDAWPRIRNSWGMSYGTNGYAVLQGNKAKADDAVTPRVSLAA